MKYGYVQFSAALRLYLNRLTQWDNVHAYSLEYSAAMAHKRARRDSALDLLCVCHASLERICLDDLISGTFGKLIILNVLRMIVDDWSDGDACIVTDGGSSDCYGVFSRPGPSPGPGEKHTRLCFLVPRSYEKRPFAQTGSGQV